MRTTSRIAQALNRLRAKPARFKVGVALLVLYPLMYLIVPIGPLLPLSGGAIAALISGVVAAAEGVLLLAIACMGKEAYQSMKAWFTRGRKRGRAQAQRG